MTGEGHEVGGWYIASLRIHVAGWNKKGEVVWETLLRRQGWFEENEDLGDIIKAHRQALVDISVLENTVKAQKKKLVELDNDNEKLQNLVLEMKKDLGILVEEVANIKAKKGGKVL